MTPELFPNLIAHFLPPIHTDRLSTVRFRHLEKLAAHVDLQREFETKSSQVALAPVVAQAVRSANVEIAKRSAPSGWSNAQKPSSGGETNNLAPGASAGDFVSAQGSVAVGTGAGGAVLVDGSNKSISLQPISVSVGAGLNLSAGIGSLNLQYMPVTPSRPFPRLPRAAW